jgi:diguanylate cyclase (GGDEF)-like protein
MVFGRKLSDYLFRFRWLVAGAGVAGTLALAIWLRQSSLSSGYSSGFVLYSYLQIVGTLLSFTYAANALVRFRGMHDRLTLILGFGFALSGLIETAAIFGFYGKMIAGVEPSHIALAWLVGRTLLAVVLLSALVVERRVPHSHEPGRELAIALLVVGAVAYLTSAAYLSAPLEPGSHLHGWLARPWDLFPALLYLAAAIGFSRRRVVSGPAFDRALSLALWLNVACHIAVTQSTRLFDAPFTLAQILKVGSYGFVLGGALLDNLRLFEQVRHMAASDCLTGLSNYRILLNSIQTEMERSRRTGRPFSVLLMDLDGLKQVNDRHGHLVGSRALIRLGEVLRLNSRAIDTAARYGGDEFALVLPDADATAAERVGERICERLASDGETPRITVSLGAAVFPSDGQTIEELLDVADRALYRMKRRGNPVLSLARIAACL